MDFVSFINPFSRLDTCNQFNQMTLGHKALTLLVSSLAFALLFGIGGVVAFRAMVHTFRKLELGGKDPLSRQAKRIDEEAKPLVHPKKEEPVAKTETAQQSEGTLRTQEPRDIEDLVSWPDKDSENLYCGIKRKSDALDEDEECPVQCTLTNVENRKLLVTHSTMKKRQQQKSKAAGEFDLSKLNLKETPKAFSVPESPPPATMSEWKAFLRKKLQEDLDEMGLQFREAVEDGDCFFDAVRYTLSHLHKKNYTVKEIRQALSDHLNALNVTNADNPYKRMMKGDLDETYESFCQKIALTAKETTSPVWGNNVTAQLVADIYGVQVQMHETLMMEVTLLDTLDGGAFEGFEYIMLEPCSPSICTQVETSTKKPASGPIKGTIQLANISRDIWGHFLPVVPKQGSMLSLKGDRGGIG